ncbi:hypothetical protein CEXT_27631 [Caerostris extrusa]|uniref:Uncharacterized protein n=1 Tax=Caerostris extrusa TaxID=172846 RepID=A0AAV4UY69_CAEEX|nr:hypothetical protein CEXT_27631 [Caerostris extrusa]
MEIFSNILFRLPLPSTPPYLPNQYFSKEHHQRDPDFARKESSQTKFRKTARNSALLGRRTALSCSGRIPF